MGQCSHLDIADGTEAPRSSAEHSSHIDSESEVNAKGGIVCTGPFTLLIILGRSYSVYSRVQMEKWRLDEMKSLV